MYASGKNLKMCFKPNAKKLAQAANEEKTLRKREWENKKNKEIG